jgi:hypothetical protein
VNRTHVVRSDRSFHAELDGVIVLCQTVINRVKQEAKTMNHIAFELRLVNVASEAATARDTFALDVLLDERDFLELVREAEEPFAIAEGHPNLAGKYEALPADVAIPCLTSKQSEKVSLYDCECGCLGCWPLLVRISESDKIVTWSDLEQPHRGPQSRASWWSYDKLGPFEFDRSQYLAALEKANRALLRRRQSNG